MGPTAASPEPRGREVAAAALTGLLPRAAPGPAARPAEPPADPTPVTPRPPPPTPPPPPGLPPAARPPAPRLRPTEPRAQRRKRDGPRAIRGREAAGLAAAAPIDSTPTARGRGLNPGKAEPGEPTRPYSPLYRVRPTEHAQRLGRARRGGSACTLRSPGFSASRGWGQGAGRRTQPRGGLSPFPQPPGLSHTRGRSPPAKSRRGSPFPGVLGWFPPSGYRPGMRV